MVKQNNYVIRGGAQGRERLRILARVMQPTTRRLFEHIGLKKGAACLDLGCGGGDVSFDLARWVGTAGTILALDRDKETLAIAACEAKAQHLDNITFARSDITTWQAEARFDCIYGRFILTHLPDPAQVLARMARALRPGGVMVVEDIDFTGHFCYPPSAAFKRYVELYSDVVRRMGADPNIGLRLPGLLMAANFENVQINVVQPTARQGEAKIMAPLTMEYIRQAVLANHLATEQEITDIVDALYAFADDPNTVLSLPRVMQVWGYRPHLP
ncbi:MAG: methyltransferase domain-containing protein [Anaerolineae bacterium]|nr:methyltransferase domain-containing protein [Anaerolineae bacterium]